MAVKKEGEKYRCNICGNGLSIRHVPDAPPDVRVLPFRTYVTDPGADVDTACEVIVGITRNTEAAPVLLSILYRWENIVLFCDLIVDPEGHSARTALANETG